jgi:hypothetical protein
MQKTSTVALSKKLIFGRKKFGVKRALWFMTCGFLTTTLTCFMLWYVEFSNTVSAAVLRQHDGISALLKLLILGIGLMVLSRLMKTSDSKEFPRLTLTSEGLIFQASSGKLVRDKWENFGPFRFVYTSSYSQKAYIIQSLRTDDEHQEYPASLYLNAGSLNVDPKDLLQEMNYRRKVSLGIDLGRDLQTHVSSVERNILMLRMLDCE